MNTLNSVLVEGFLVADAGLVTTVRGVAVCRFKVEHYWLERDELVRKVSCFEVAAHSRLAEVCQEGIGSAGGWTSGWLPEEKVSQEEVHKIRNNCLRSSAASNCHF
jgi:hypothetical protein